MLKLDLIQTVAFAGVVLYLGHALVNLIKPLSKYSIPAPVVGGLVIALINLLAKISGYNLFDFDMTLREPLMIAFFTTVGFSASLSLLKIGGPQVILFYGLATAVVFLQNVLGVLLTFPFHIHALYGVIAGSMTMTGGPATAMAFGPVFEQAGVPAGTTVALAAAIFGIIAGGLVGGPVATFIIGKRHLKTFPSPVTEPFSNQIEVIPAEADITVEKYEETIKAKDFIKNVVILLLAMGIGAWLSRLIAQTGITLPAYIGAMLVAATIRNLDDFTQILRLSEKTLETIGHTSLALFLAMALMTLKLWELAGLVFPLLVILFFQVILVAVVAIWPIFPLMGKDYDAAVMSGGFFGFALGTTANAMANMKALVDRFGRAPRAFLVVPLVGAFFIDFTNALIITLFLNIFR
ncbi:MAG: sodium/glutamate symporter [Candidatus Aminicenantes bacterium]|nr:sodium/glutamate symporter [Candidatus Aminicenantes bacterium]